MMGKGAEANFSWVAAGGAANVDAHGEPDNDPAATHGYGKDRGVEAEGGMLAAALDERHGWSWRNRTRRAVRATLCTDGDHQGTERAL